MGQKPGLQPRRSGLGRRERRQPDSDLGRRWRRSACRADRAWQQRQRHRFPPRPRPRTVARQRRRPHGPAVEPDRPPSVSDRPSQDQSRLILRRAIAHGRRPVRFHSRTVRSPALASNSSGPGPWWKAMPLTLLPCPVSSTSRSPPAASQIRIRLSTLPAAKARPSGLKARLLTHPEVEETMSMAPFARRVSTSNNRTVFSRPPLARSLPSGLNATALTSSLALRLAIDARRSTSQSRAVPSAPALASSFPSGLNVTALTGPP